MMNVLDILSGRPSAEYESRMAGQTALDELRNKSLFDAMKENRLERRVKGAVGSLAVPETPLPQGMTGPPDPAQAATGMFSGDPQSQLLSQVLLANMNPAAFQPMLTQATKPVKPEGAPAAIKVGTLQKKKVDTPQGPKEISVRYLGGDVRDQANWEEVGSGTYFAPYQSRGSGLREQYDFDYYRSLDSDADSTKRTADKYAQINEALTGVETGLGDEAILATQKFAKLMGVEAFDDSIAAKEVADKLYAEATVDLMKPDSESGKRALAGQSSDKELAFFQKLPPGLGKTRAGRQLIALVARERAKRADIISNLSIDAEKNGESARTFRSRMRERFQFGDRDVPEEWRALTGQIDAELNAKKSPRAQVVNELPPGFIMRADGTAHNPETGQIARPQ
ncbi:MAG: hypothetical protein KAR40_07885 [Candidatus Sabulitectum sp.]|nr:hypothetical protein [Candidatus Sabulitectum sp.]